MKFFPLLALLLLALLRLPSADIPPRWTPAKTAAWMAQYPLPVGCNYTPATAANQLEMWQAATFDLPRIDQELAWAHDLGFNSMRVFLHNLAWRQDPAGFLDRMDRFLAVAARHGISVMFVFFDGVWNPYPKAGPQPAPVPGVQLSQWVQSPGREFLENLSTHGELEAYIKSVLGRFRDDKRVIAWDLFNEPEHSNPESYPASESPHKEELGLILMREAFAWAREVNPAQPLTAAVWIGEWGKDAAKSPSVQFMLDNSDLITFHCYQPLEKLQAKVALLKTYGRPLLCTEYLSRPRNSRFETILPYLKGAGVGAYNWGFVQGKTGALYPRDSWSKPYAGEPSEWNHDLLRFDGTPYRDTEVRLIRDALRDLSPAKP